MAFLVSLLVVATHLLATCTSQAVPVPPGSLVAAPFLPVQSGPKTYAFGYETSDGLGMTQRRHETSDPNGIVEGSYAYTDPLGVYRIVSYIADAAGFRTRVKSNEPGMANSNPANAEFVVEPPPPAAILQGARLVLPIQNALLK